MTTDYQPGQAWLPPGGAHPAPSFRHPEHRSLGEALPIGTPAREPEPRAEVSDGGPAIGPVVALTLFFGPLGAFSAARRTSRAEAAGLPTKKYWQAFGWTWAGGLALSIMVAVTVALLLPSLEPVPVVAADGISADWLEGSIVDQGRFRGTDGKVAAPRAADCAGTRVGADGAGLYHCTIDFPGDHRSVVDVTVAGNGEWSAV